MPIYVYRLTPDGVQQSFQVLQLARSMCPASFGVFILFLKKMFFDSICSEKLKTSALLTIQGLSSIEFSSFVCALSFCSYLKMHFITKDDKEKKLRK